MLDVPTDERASWISRLSGVEAQMAPRLRSLLNANRNGSPWLETLPPFVSAEGDLGTEPDLVDHQPGDDIGPYRLIRLLGRGGMASVWYAQRNDLLVSRAVALKLPLSRGVQSNFRFAREREIVSRLEHPHIARLYDAGIDAKGHTYVALEYVDGIPITDFCEQRRLSLRERIDLFAQVLGAVQYAHSRLVIHRDLKPSNILVTSAGQVCLLDFGVAKLLGADERDNVELTRAGVVLMTPAYASPEQVVGDPVTPASDIYSLGVILYELLLGVRPYRISRAGRGALEEAILRGDIPLPSAVPMLESTAAVRSTTVRKFRRELRPDLDAILLRALHQRPEQRYVSASAFADDLDSYRQGKPVQAHRPSRWYQSKKFITRHRLAVAGGGAFTLALVAAVVIALWQARNASQQASAAARERDLAIAAKQHREAVDEFLSDLLLEAGGTGKPISVGS